MNTNDNKTDAILALENMKANGFDLGLEEEDYLALDAAIEALAAALRLREWRPIAEAPKGTMVLCADMEAREARHWAFVGWRHAESAKGCVTTPDRVNRPATHFTHLPAPPTADDLARVLEEGE